MHSRPFLRSSVPLAVATMLLLPGSAWGQASDSGSITLQVSDPSGAIVPGSQLVLTDKSTNVVRNGATLTSGSYTFQSLPYGHYRLSVTREGFQNAVYEDVVVRSGVSTKVDVKLAVGGTTSTVEISSMNTPVLETTSNTLSTTIDLQQVQNLPIAGRDLTQLAYLVPGYASTGASSGDGTFSGMAQSTISANIDGVNSTSSRFKSGYGYQSSVSPRVENIQELTVQTGELDPSQGAGQSAAQVLFATERGTNTIHGRIFEDHQNGALNANSWNNNAIGQRRGKLIVNSFGGNIGGPVLKNRVFLFLDYSQTIVPGSNTVGATVPTAAAASGIYTYYTDCAAADASTCPTASINVYDVAAKAGFPSTPNPITTAQIAKNAAAYKYGKLTSTTADLNRQTLSWQQPYKTTTYYPAGRMDWTISRHHSLNLATNYNKNATIGAYASQFPGPDFASQLSGNARRSYVVSLGEDWTITPNLLNQLRAGYLYTSSSFSPEFNGLDVSKMSNQAWDFSTSGVVATTAQTSFYPYLTLTDNVLLQKGAHSFKFGGNLFHQQDHYYNPPVGYPNYSIGVSYNDPVSTPLIDSVPTSGSSLPSDINGTQGGVQALYGLLAGRVSFASASYAYHPSTGTYGNGTFNLNEVTLGGGLFAMDSWRVRPGLTLNYGLRWDMISAVRDRNNAYTGPDVSSLWGPSGVGNLFKPGTLTGNQNPTFAARSSAYNASLLNPEPQVGFAWNPQGGDGVLGRLGGAGKTVLRGSFTLKNYTEGGQNFWRYASNYGFNFFQYAYLYPDTSGAYGSYQPGSLTLGNALPSFGLSPATFQKTTNESDLTFSGQDAATINPNIRQPYVESWTLGFQRQIGRSSALEVRYVGNHGVHSWISENINQVNIAENGFTQEFKNAQANLAINKAAGRASGDFENHGDGRPIPLLTQAFGGAGAGDFTNGTFATFLRNGAAGSFANQLATSPAYFCNIVGSNFAPCATITTVGSSAYPVNYFQANPFVAGYGASYLDSTGTSNYNALQVEFRQQNTHGLEFDANYTYAKTLGISTQRSIDNTGNFYDLHNKQLNYQPSAFDIRNTFHANGTYSLPFGKGRAMLSTNNAENFIFGGWTVGGIVQYQSGTPSILVGGYSTVNGQADSGVDFAPGTDARTLQSSVHVTRNTNGNPWVNLLPSTYRGAAHANYSFVSPHTDPGSFGHLNFLYGPKWINTDMALTKAFPIHERFKFNLQGEFLNAFNHPAFGFNNNSAAGNSSTGTSTNVQSARFGTTSTLLNGPRRIELRANLTF